MAPWVGDSHNTLNPLNIAPGDERVAALRMCSVASRLPEAERVAAARVVLDAMGLIPTQPTPEPTPEPPPVVPWQRQKPRRVRPGRRWCSMHAASHPVAAFGRDAANPDGLASSCREARGAAQRRQRVDARRAEQ